MRNIIIYFMALIIGGIIIISNTISLDYVVEIDDIEVLYEKKNKSYPISINLIDEVWGSNIIDDEKIILNLIEKIGKIPVSSKDFSEEIGISTSRPIKGVINYLEGSRVEFSIDKLIELDGIQYGDKYSLYNISLIRQILLQSMYSVETLERLINSYNNIVVTWRNERRVLSEIEKSYLAQEVLKTEKIELTQEFNELFRNRGDAVCQIQVFNKENSFSPEIYMIVYENSITTLYDTNNAVGAVMYLRGNLMNFFEKVVE